MTRIALSLLAVALMLSAQAYGAGIIIDHNDTDITSLTQAEMQRAKDDLHIAYTHTSHGSQVTDGMSGLVGFANVGGLGLSLPHNFFDWNNGGTGDALDLHDYATSGDAGGLSEQATRDYLNANPDVNVMMWSWCGQASDRTELAMISTYLQPITQLEGEYANVNFIYMTGHLDGTGEEGNLHQRNEQIRQYCIDNDKILYDFADIESYDPDGNYYGDKYANDNCDYDPDGLLPADRTRNWATEWADSHAEDVDWYDVYAAHSQALNGNRKAYAAWALWSAIAAPQGPVYAPGDANCDGTVDLQDFGTLKHHFGTSSGATWEMGDFNDDGAITLDDFILLKNNFASAGPGTVIPEPVTIALMTLAGAGLAARRRRA